MAMSPGAVRRPRMKFSFVQISCVLLGAMLCLGTGFMLGTMNKGGDIVSIATSTLESSDAVARLREMASVAPGSRAGQRNGKIMKVGEICTNSCSKANNGVCDDGRFLQGEPHTLPECELGTDCGDCGPWEPTFLPTWDAAAGKGPLSLLVDSKKIQVRVRDVSFTVDDEPAYRFAYTDPEKDVDVSANLQSHGTLEHGITHVFYSIFKGRCLRKDGSRALFLDVGSNFGWFSILAARMGCRVIAYEPVPHFRAFLEYNVYINGLEHLVEVRPKVVTDTNGANMTMVVPSGGIWGTAGIDGLNIDHSLGASIEEVTVASDSLGEAVKEDVLLMKVDVEGWEWAVMKGAEALFANHEVSNIIMEYSPGVPERNAKYKELHDTVAMLSNMHSMGFRIAHLQHKEVAGEKLDDPLGPFYEVLPGHVLYDSRDAASFSNNTLGCPQPNEGVWALRSCGGSIPEDLNPRGFRASFGHNTNIWASRMPGSPPLDGEASLLPLNTPGDKWFVESEFEDEGVYGVGWRRCRDMDPQWQVRHRCHCTDKNVCGKEEAQVLKWAKEGKLEGPNYVIAT